MQIAKGEQNVYPVLGGIDGPPCPEGCKYGGLALQVEIWSTGRQSVIHKKLPVRKPNLWPRNSPTEWNLPRQWKMMNAIKIATRHVRTLYTAGAINDITDSKFKTVNKY